MQQTMSFQINKLLNIIWRLSKAFLLYVSSPNLILSCLNGEGCRPNTPYNEPFKLTKLHLYNLQRMHSSSTNEFSSHTGNWKASLQSKALPLLLPLRDVCYGIPSGFILHKHSDYHEGIAYENCFGSLRNILEKIRDI